MTTRREEIGRRYDQGLHGHAAGDRESWIDERMAAEEDGLIPTGDAWTYEAEPTPSHHRAEARRILDEAVAWRDARRALNQADCLDIANRVAMAQVHATLALSAPHPPIFEARRADE